MEGVAEGFDAGVRLGEAVPQDMVAIPFGGDEQFICIAAPSYLERFGTPSSPDELHKHRCIRFKLPSGKIYRWEFERQGQSLKLEIDGPMTLDHMGLMVDAATRGVGIAHVSSEIARQALQRGQLVTILTEWTPPFAGQFLYYPSHRLVPAALRAFVDVLKEVEQYPTIARERGCD